MSNSSQDLEIQYFKEALSAFDGYAQYHLSANNGRRMNFLTLPRDQREILSRIGYREKLDAVDEGIRRNSEFLDEVYRSGAKPFMGEHTHEHADSHSESHSHFHSHGSHSDHSHTTQPTILSPPSPSHSQIPSIPLPPTDKTLSPSESKHQNLLSLMNKHASLQVLAKRDNQMDKVRSTLRSLVRDWTVGGEKERKVCYDPCVKAVEDHFSHLPPSGRGEIKVLVPGAGLGRLALDFASKGFAAQGNEFSAHMLIASNWVLNESTSAHQFQIFPNLHSFSNHLTTEQNLLRSYTLPDILPSSLLPADSQFSFVAGDFEEVYGGKQENGAWGPIPEDQAGQWGAVVTCFFLDTARNVINYLKIIKGLLREDGIWVNVGPLLWHWENVQDRERGEGSIELSLDEVKELAREMGFIISNEKMDTAAYTGDPDTMLRSEYQVAFWTATKIKESE